MPAGVASGIQAGELVGKLHQFADLQWRELAQLLDQFLGVVQVLRLGEAVGDRRGLVVQGLGGEITISIVQAPRIVGRL